MKRKLLLTGLLTFVMGLGQSLLAQFTEDFEGTFPPTGWSVINNGDANTWFQSAPGTGSANSGTNVARIDYDASTAHDDYLVTAQFTVTAGVSDRLSFYAKNRSASFTEEFNVLLSSTGNTAADFTTTIDTLVGPPSSWQQYTYDLSAYVGQTVYIALHAISLNEWELYIDDLVVDGFPSCQVPSALGVITANTTTTTAEVYWTGGGASDWNVEYGTTGFTQGAGTMINATNDTITLTSLSAQTTYDFYVRDSCGVGDVSAWVGPFSFNTLGPDLVLTYTNDFETTLTDFVNAAGNTDDFVIDTAKSSGTTSIRNEYSANATNRLTLPNPINLSTYPNAVLTFDQIAKTEGTYDECYVEYSTDAGATWQVIPAANYTGASTDYATSEYFHEDSYSDWGTGDVPISNSWWKTESFNLSGLSTGSILIRFSLESDGSAQRDGWYIDNLIISNPSCVDPSALGATSLTATTADIFWTTGGASNWNVEYGTTGFTQGAGTMINATNDTLTLTSLSAQTDYDFYVRDSCGVGNVSAWVGPFSFTTACAAPLSGAYTINPGMATGGTNFNSFNDALAGLSSCGVSAAVTFNVVAGTYTENIVLTEIPGASAVNKVIFNGGSASTAEITHTSTTDEPTIYFDGADHVEIRNMTISNNSTSDGWGILLENSADSNTVDSCHIKMPVTTTTDIIGIVASNSLSFETSTGDNANYLTISNCTITGGETGVHLTGGSSSASHNLGNKIINNVFRNQDDHGIEVDGQTDLLVEGNDVDSLNNSGGDGIYLTDVNDFEVLANRVVAPDWGIYVTDGNDGYSATVNSRVINNMSISSTDYGIYLSDFEFVEVYHNNAVGEPAMAINDQDTTVIIKNNIFYSTADYAFESLDALKSNDVIDYNVYYSGGTNAFEILSTTYADLAAWQSGDATRNVNSLEGDPAFVDATFDLHVLGTIANDVADPSVGVTIDIDGETRSGTTPDIGADEYAPASCTPPSGLGVFNIGLTTVDVFWTTGGASNWNVEYGAAGFTLGSGTLVQATNDTLTISSLTAATMYDFYVQDSCGVGDVSGWVGPFSFVTSCAPFTAPYSQNFDGAAAQDPFGGIACWSVTGPGANDIELNDSPDAGVDPAPSLPNSVELNDGDFGGGDTAILVSPQFSDLPSGLNQIRFKAAFEDGGQELYIGVMSDPLVASTLVILDTVTNSTADVYTEFTIPLDNTTAIGTAEYVAFVHGTDIWEVYVDDFFYEALPACPDPTALGVTNITATSADIFWTTGGASNWNVEYGPAGFAFGTGTPMAATNDTLSLSSLTAGTGYEFYVQDSCGLGNVSTWVGPFAFATSCASFASNVANDSICTPGLTGFNTTLGSNLVLLNGANQVVFSDDDTLSFFTSNDTTVSVIEAAYGGLTGNVGPLTSIAASGFGNFSNGQWITVMDTIRIDSMTVRANGEVTAAVRISLDDSGNTELQRSAEFTTGTTTGDYQVPVGLVLTPGVYFMNVDFISGAGQLFRSTAGASYPYTLAGLMSIDSTNFSSQARIYYTFDLVVSKMCMGTAQTVTSYIISLSAGNGSTLAFCDNGGTVDMSTFLTADAATGGTWGGTGLGGSLTGSILDPVALAGNYTLYYTVPGIAGCPADTAFFDIQVDACASCAGLLAPVLTGDTTCGPGTATLSGVTSASDILWTDANDDFIAYGDSVDVPITVTSTFKAQSVLSNGPGAVVGPGLNISANAYPTGNFTNGQFITAHQDVRIDSATFAVNGALDFVVAILDPTRTDTLQVSKLVSFAGADTSQKEVGIFLAAGTYFMGVIPISGTGILWRPTAGASYPYGVPNLLTADSSDFGPTRYYYVYEMIVSGACISTADSVQGVVEATLNAGTDAADTLCDTSAVVDLSTYLGGGVTAGGTWVDVNSSGGLTGSNFDPSAVTAGATYDFRYEVSGAACPDDDATVSIYVEDCDISLDEHELSTVTLYPNPAKGAFYVEDMDKNSQKLDVEILAIDGRLLRSYNFSNTGRQEIGISDLAAGVYNVKVSSEKGFKVFRVVFQD